MSNSVILLEDEPLSSALCKWAGWMAVMVIFIMCLIYFSCYFARNSEWFIDERYISHPIQDIKNRKWRHRFQQVDKLTYI